MIILADIGGTKIRVAYSNGKEFETPLVMPTPSSFDEALELLDASFKKVANQRLVRKVVMGLPGIFDQEFGELTWSPNLREWTFKSIRKLVEKIIPGSLALFCNDSALVGLGEAVYGAGRGHKIVMYLTVSTGVGGARIVNKEIDKYAVGFEPGQQIIGVGGRTLEESIGVASFKRRFGKNPREVSDIRVWDKAAHDLAVGIYNGILHWSPDVVVVGGPMVLGKPAISLETVRHNLERIAKPLPKLPALIPAELKDLGGLYGALAFSQISANKDKIER